MLIFKLIYWAGMLAEVVIRAPYQKAAREGEKIDRRPGAGEQVIPMLLSLGTFAMPAVYALTNWMDFAAYHLPGWTSWLGVILLAAAVYVFWRSHRDLRANWSPTLEIRDDHSLVTGGIYSWVRHPMYASEILWVLAQPLLLQNWLAGPVGLVCFIPVYLLRVPAEEKMMQEKFGEEYAAYKRRVGSVIPKLTGRRLEG